MQQEVQAYSTKGFFPAPSMDGSSYVALMKAREAACRDFVNSAQDSLVPILKAMNLKDFAGKRYDVEVGTLPNCELLAVQDSPIPHIRVEYAKDSPGYRGWKNPISDLREKRKSKRAGAYKTFIHYNGVDIPVIVTTKRGGVRVRYRKDEPESITPDSIHELTHAARSDLDLIGDGPLLVELFSQQFDVEERMAALYEGLRDKRPKSYVQYYPEFTADGSSTCVLINLPVNGVDLEDLGGRPTPRIRNTFQSEICGLHDDYKGAKGFLERLATESLDGLFFYFPEYRAVVFAKPKRGSIEKSILAAEAKEVLRTEDSLTQIADALGYAHTKFLRVISRLTYQEANTVSDRLNKSVPLDTAIAETVQPWRMSMFEELLTKDDEVKLVRAPTRIGEAMMLLQIAMTGKAPKTPGDIDGFVRAARQIPLGKY